MNQFKVTFKRIEVFYQTIIIEASNHEEACTKADALSVEGSIEYDYFDESDILDEHIIDIIKL